jgi:predicted negative regulator of RcsB-dependent stress response
MLEFIITNYILFIVIGIVLLLGLFGYMMDKKKYNDYREEILNEDKAIETMDASPNIQTVATPVSIDSVPTVENESNNMTV